MFLEPIDQVHEWAGHGLQEQLCTVQECATAVKTSVADRILLACYKVGVILALGFQVITKTLHYTERKRETERQRERKIERKRAKQRERQRETATKRNSDRETETERGKQTDRGMESGREKERERKKRESLLNLCGNLSSSELFWDVFLIPSRNNGYPCACIVQYTCTYMYM